MQIVKKPFISNPTYEQNDSYKMYDSYGIMTHMTYSNKFSQLQYFKSEKGEQMEGITTPGDDDETR